MKNLYQHARNKNTERVVEPVNPLEIKKQQLHVEWLKHEHTQEFINFLLEEETELKELAIRLACNGAKKKQITKALISANKVKEIISYARRNRRTDDDGN